MKLETKPHSGVMGLFITLDDGRQLCLPFDPEFEEHMLPGLFRSIADATERRFRLRTVGGASDT